MRFHIRPRESQILLTKSKVTQNAEIAPRMMIGDMPPSGLVPTHLLAMVELMVKLTDRYISKIVGKVHVGLLEEYSKWSLEIVVAKAIASNVS